MLDHAWSYQCTVIPKDWDAVDVDQECLLLLEERLFETSARAGAAGHYQWGLDAGSHQNDWDPYANRPSHWNHGDRDGSESEMQVCMPNSLTCHTLTPITIAGSIVYKMGGGTSRQN